MQPVTILAAFDGYPDGAVEGSRRVSYAEGREIEVDDAFADLITGKGLARTASADPSPKPAAAEPAHEEDDAP